MKNDVKITTLGSILDVVCPHSCRGCGHLGDVLCGCCKNDIFLSHLPICPFCKRILEENEGKCKNCETTLKGIYTVGWREGVLAKLIKDFKYQAVRACGRELAELMDMTLPKMEGMTVIPLPTIGRHVRERGLDHTLILAKKLAKRRSWKCEQILRRKTDTVQVGTKAAEREKQAQDTYEIGGKIDPKKRYLLVDDVWTTGATIRAAENVLRGAGALEISAAVLAVSK